MKHSTAKYNSRPVRLDGKSRICHFAILIFSTILISQCTRIEELLHHQSPRESYIHAIQSSPFADKPIVQQWITKGDSALQNAYTVKPAFQQELIYFADAPYAWAWEVDVQAGRRMEFVCKVSDTAQQLFVDLFSVEEGEVYLVQSMEDTILHYEASENTTLILRLQPEILISGQASIQVKDYPILGFPVQGASHSDIGSFWGDARDGGRRLHEGVDIFAARGTPVIAVAEGRVSRTGNGGLGGKKVWLRSGHFSLYYAHLDSIIARSGQAVAIGDTLGTVGNTGNARTTPPHLHFGIYRRGAMNPLPFIEPSRVDPPPLISEIDPTTRWGRITSTANVRSDASTNRPALTTLTRNEVLAIRGITDGWYEVILPGKLKGFIHHSLITFELTPLANVENEESAIWIFPVESARKVMSPEPVPDLKSYGRYGDWTLARYSGHWVGVGK